jgi:hypothetical protein
MHKCASRLCSNTFEYIERVPLGQQEEHVRQKTVKRNRVKGCEESVKLLAY